MYTTPSASSTRTNSSNYDIDNLNHFSLVVNLSEAQCKRLKKKAKRAERENNKPKKEATVSTNPPAVKMIKIEQHDGERPSTSSGVRSRGTFEEVRALTNEPSNPPPVKMIKIEQQEEEERPRTSSEMRSRGTFEKVRALTNEPSNLPPVKMIKIEQQQEEERPSTSSGVMGREDFEEVRALRNEPSNPLPVKMIKIEQQEEEERPSTSLGVRSREDFEEVGALTNEPFNPPPVKMIKIEPQEEERPSTSSGVRSRGTFDEVGAPLKMVVFLKGYPAEKLDEGKVQLIKKAILSKVWQCKPSEGPQFTNYFFERGVLYIDCATEMSKNWLKSTIPLITPWHRAILRVCEPTEFKIFKVKVQIPTTDISEANGIENLLSLFKIQNECLDVEKWSIIDVTVEREHTMLDIYIDKKSFEALTKAKYEVYFGLSKLTFKPVTGSME